MRTVFLLVAGNFMSGSLPIDIRRAVADNSRNAFPKKAFLAASPPLERGHFFAFWMTNSLDNLACLALRFHAN